MIAMLIKATLSKKLTWKENEGTFSTSVSGCEIKLWSSYDYSIDTSSYTLQLSNCEDVVFVTYTYSENVNVDEYKQLDNLYNSIRDVNYRISESEKCILDALKELTKPDDDLPF